ncbi:MAG TPA: sialate O-acetylesterase [Polyangiaceae bacterium]
MSLVLGSPFADHMVLPRDRATRFWGWDSPGGSVAVTLESGRGEVIFEGSAVADAETGAFSCMLPALAPPGPYRLRVRGSEARVLEDVLAGDVWLASGQSNMEWTVAQAADAERELLAARYPRIRVLYVDRRAASAPAATVGCRWFEVTPETAAGVTAVGYFFARELHRELGVPIGIVDAAWGGTRIEAWASAEALTAVMPFAEERARYDPPIEELARAVEERAERLRRWEAENLPADAQNEGEAWGYASPDFDDRAWRTLRVPGMWQRAGLAFNGVVWFRRWFELPRALAGQELLLSLGRIDDFDHTYLNGVLIGSHPKGTDQACLVLRRYRVPANLLHEGTNLLAVRVFDHVGEGGFVGPSSALYLERPGCSEERVPLAGEYRIGVEREVPLVPLTVFKTYPLLPPELEPQNSPAALHNGMLAPLVPFGIRGVLFYQGETNTHAPEQYAPRFRAFLRDLRVHFGRVPVYFVELAGYRENDGWPLIREAQADALAEPDTGMASAIDLGEPDDIHPRNKLDVARRLVRLALARTYGRSDVVSSGPVMSNVTLGGAESRVEFTSSAGLRTTDGEAPRAFEVAGPDGVFLPARASIEGNSVIVSSERVNTVTALRYAFADYAEVNLVNEAGLPARPFRTRPS